jgi:Ni,Fe-hydrogenase I small subunit
MVEKVALKLFWVMMLLCTGSALTLIWAGNVLPQQLVPTFFIVGFASFLIWAPLVVYKFLAKIG